jgi:N-acetyl-anhydromuramoyl-L-alanine amidase
VKRHTRHPAAAAAPARHRAPRLAVDAAGRANLATQICSPNCDERPDDTPVSLIVVHGISLPPGEFGGDAIERLFTNRLDPAAHPFYATVASLRVSAHFLIRREGSLLQFVPCSRRAWHAGESTWRGRPCCNDYSIGIEAEGTDDLPYTDAQYTLLARLVRALCKRYPITGVAGHADIAPGRKTDPGPAFDWPRLHAALARGPATARASLAAATR